MRTCKVLDRIVQLAATALGDCSRNEACTMITCIDSNVTNSVTIFPCTNPILVNAFTNGGFGFNSNIFKTTLFPVSPFVTDIVTVRQTPGGIRFGVRI